MPTYTHSCLKCNITKTLFSSIAERDSQKCPECGTPTKRLIDKPGMVWAPTSTGGGHK